MRAPSVIWIVADQLRAQALGHAGDPNVRTPNLDRLAAEGVRFTRAAATSPLCTPARGAMLTGRSPRSTSIAGHRHPMASSERTIATEMRRHGYRTCYVGKWHLDGDRDDLDREFTEDEARTRMIPPSRRGGFDAWWAYENNNRPFDCLLHTDEGSAPAGSRIVDRADNMVQFRLDGYETDASTTLLLDWLGDLEDEDPFFAVLSVQPPHNPYIAPAESIRVTPADIRLRANVPPVAAVQDAARRDLSGYYGAIERFNENVGRVRDRLVGLARDEDTYVVVTSDHGDLHGSHGQFRKTAPWDESIRVPFLIGGPSRTWGRRIPSLTTHLDLAPTTLGLCGLPVSAWMEGADLSAVVLDAAAQGPTRDVLVEQPVPTGHHASVDAPWYAVLSDDGWKYVELEGRPWLLFNLVADPYELADHAHDPLYADRRAAMRAALHRLIACARPATTT